MGFNTNEGHSLSPATSLNHEADHADQKDKNPEQYKNDKKKRMQIMIIKRRKGL